MATTRCCVVFREHHKRLCDILHTSPSTLTSFTIALYAKEVIDMKTKNEVLRIKGFEGADTLLDHVMLKLQANPTNFTTVLEVVLAEDALSDIGKEMESKLHSRQSLTVSNRHIPIIEAPSTDAINFVEQLKSVYDELVDVIFNSVKNVDVSNLRVRLNVFFMSDGHVDANDLLCKLDSCKTTEDVLLCLIRANFIGYLNYKLLKVFAKASSNEQALKSIDDYGKEYLKLFKCEIPSLIKLFRNPRLTAIPPVSLPEFTVRLGTANDQSDPYSFKEFFENRFSWAEHLLIVDVVEKCILIKYGVLPFFVSAVARDLTDPAIIEELKKEDITIELSPQLKDIARHHDDQLALEVLPSLHDISSSDVSLFLRSHDLAMTDTQKSQLQTMTAVTHNDSNEDESQVGTVVSEDSQSIAKASELEGLPMKKVINDWDEHGREAKSSSGVSSTSYEEYLKSLGLHIKADASLAEKVFVYEKALKQLLEEEKSIEIKSAMHNKMVIELNKSNETVADLKKEINAKEQELDTKEEEMHLTIDELKNQNEALLEETKLLKDQLNQKQTPKTESDHPPPTIDSMNEALKDLVDWESLAQHVPGITSEMIHDIKGRGSLHNMQKHHFFNQWLSCHPNLSWNDVIGVLMKASAGLATNGCYVFREYYKQLCNLLRYNPSTLTSFTIALYAKGIIDYETKDEVFDIEQGLDAADALLNRVLLMLQGNPKRFTTVLEIILAEDVLFDVGKQMESLHSRQSLTVSNRRIEGLPIQTGTHVLNVFRDHHKRLCDILYTSPSTLASFTSALYSKAIIDMKTRSEVLRIKGSERADALLSHVLLKLQANPKRFTIVLEIILAEDALSDVGKEMESLLSRQSLTVSNRRIPIIEASTTDAIEFAKHLKLRYEELVDVIYDAVRNVDVENLKVRLSVFFMSNDRVDADNDLFLKLDSCKTTKDIFLCLVRANFIGYLNYKLLEVFAKASSNEQALKSIDDYEKEYLKLFKCNFPSLIKLFRNPRLTTIPLVSLPEFTIRLGTADDQSDLYNFKEIFENRFSWAGHLLILEVMKN